MEVTTQEKIETSFFERQLVVFTLGDEYLGVDISDVNEISKMIDITPVPHSDPTIAGIVNLRGQIATVIDLGQRLKIPTVKDPEEMRVLVFENGSSVVGFIVDSSNEVLHITGDQIKDAPKTLLEKIDDQYLQGVVVLDDRLISIIDLGVILSELSGTKKEEHDVAVDKKKVLIVEDSSMMRGTLKSYVDKSSFTVLEASDGEEGLQKAKHDKPDIILLDIKLPRKNGVQVLRELKAFGSTAKVIMETSVYEEDTRKECLALGAKAYLKKPITKKDLQALLQNVA